MGTAVGWFGALASAWSQRARSGARELRLLAGVGEESRGERGGRERGRGRGALARPYRATAEVVGGGRGVAEEDEK